MNWTEKINKSLQYIEDNIRDEFTLEDVAHSANSSLHNFLRIFNILTDKTLGSYIRERRLTLAAWDLTNSNKRVLDIALSYYYESSEAFSMAFKRFHNISPMQARNNPMKLKATPPIKLNLTITGKEIINFRIIKKPSFTITGPKIDIDLREDRNLEKPHNIWEKCFKNGEFTKLEKLQGDMGVFSASYNRSNDNACFSYMVAIERNNKISSIHELLEIPELTWATFPGKGTLPDSIKKLWIDIYANWFPATKYTQTEGPVLEIYKNHDELNSNYEIWIPIML